MKKKLSLISFILFCCVLSVSAQRIQVVDTDGLPIAQVCVTNEKGVFIGTTDNDGWLEDTRGAQVLNLSHIAFQDIAVPLANITNNRIVMEDVEYILPDVEVKPKELAYVQTYFRLIYLDDDGPLYYRGGVIDNTYEFSNHKTSSKTRSLSKGESGLMRFLISTAVGRYIDKLGQLSEVPTYQKILKYAEEGLVTLTTEPSGRIIVSDSVCTLGYIDTDTVARTRTTSFNNRKFLANRKNAEAKAKGKKVKERKEKDETYYEVYRIDEDGRSRSDDFIMRQWQISTEHSHSSTRYMILLQAYATDYAYVDKKEYKQLRKENKVDMEIEELRRFENAHNIPVLAPDVKAAVDKLFEKDLNKKN
jgi:hypothetical protein